MLRSFFSPKECLGKLYSAAVFHNIRNIESLLSTNTTSSYLDLGCDDGQLTIRWANKLNTKNINGVELSSDQGAKALRLGIKVIKSDLNRDIGYSDNSIDVITANQVIEHLTDSDQFLKEIYRVLKPGGYAVISTENASSWCNIIASIFGWQIFSLTNFSSLRAGIGNPLALHKNELISTGWTHIRIWNIRGLREYFEVLGFKVSDIKGAGYFPLPSCVANVDVIHAHFISFKICKPK